MNQNQVMNQIQERLDSSGSRYLAERVYAHMWREGTIRGSARYETLLILGDTELTEAIAEVLKTY